MRNENLFSHAAYWSISAEHRNVKKNWSVLIKLQFLYAVRLLYLNRIIWYVYCCLVRLSLWLTASSVMFSSCGLSDNQPCLCSSHTYCPPQSLWCRSQKTISILLILMSHTVSSLNNNCRVTNFSHRFHHIICKQTNFTHKLPGQQIITSLNCFIK